MLGIELSSLFIIYTDRKIPGVDLQMGGLSILYRNLNRFTYARQPLFIAARDIKLIFPRFYIYCIGFQRQYGTPILTTQ